MANIPVSHGKESAGDPLPPKCALIEVRVAELKQLFNSIDPSPFRNKDLDPRAEEFIIGWAKDLPKDAPLGLWLSISTARPVCPMRLPFFATQFTSSSVSGRMRTGGVCASCSASAGRA